MTDFERGILEALYDNYSIINVSVVKGGGYKIELQEWLTPEQISPTVIEEAAKWRYKKRTYKGKNLAGVLLKALYSEEKLLNKLGIQL